MSLYTMPNLSSGIDDALVETVSAIPIFTPMLLLFIFCVVFISGVISQKRRMGTADMPMWSVVASVITLMVSLLLTLREGLIQIEVLSVVVVITLICGVWLFLSQNRNEV